MTDRRTRLARAAWSLAGVLAVAVVGWGVGGCGSDDDDRTASGTSSVPTVGSGPSTSSATSVPTTVEPTVEYALEVPDSIRQVTSAVEAAKAGGDADLARLSNGLVHVNAAGAVEVVLHSAAPVGDAQLADLSRLGVEVVDNSQTPAVGGRPAGGLVQAWVPADQLPAVAGLPWVLAVTPPSYPPTGG